MTRLKHIHSIQSCIIFLLLTTQVLAQQEPKRISASRIYTVPKIDGILSENIWEGLPILDQFPQYVPHNGQPASCPSEVRVAYDDNAIYIGAEFYDPTPDSIARSLGKRDSGDGVHTDLFGLQLSPYNDAINSYLFFVSAAGAQTDVLISSSGEDVQWNAVWESSVNIHDNGWTIEVGMPLSAIRFPDTETQNWGLNVIRLIKRREEWSSWSFIDRKADEWYTETGELIGLKNLEPPLRLSFVPYLSAYLENNADKQTGYSYHGGMDMKYGINESYTLDLTLIPDFGNVQSDDKELNLSPYEIRYDEKRQFFLEGTDLFQKAGIFYSRRIGAEPALYNAIEDSLKDNEKVTANPAETQLINASKISGRNRNGLGVGVFNAMTAKSTATIEDTLTGEQRKLATQPFTNFNIMVIDKTIRKNSYVSLINTNVKRDDFMANVTGTEFRLADKANRFHFWNQTAFSQKFDSDTSYDDGFKSTIFLGKVAGSLQYEYVLSMKSNTFDPNDLGYLQQNNEFEHHADIEYNIFKPFGRILQMSQKLSFSHTSLYKPRKFQEYHIDYSGNVDFKNYWYTSMHASWRPVENRDFFEPRVAGRVFITPPMIHNCGGFSSDSKKPFSIGVHGGFNKYYKDSYNRFQYWINVNPKLRFNTRLILYWNIYYQNNYNDIGYVDHEDDESAIYFGKRRIHTVENTITTEYIFTSDLSLNFRLRHYRSKADYNQYFTLTEAGYLENNSAYSENHDINYNRFNIDMSFTWHFAPGSELMLVYKNSIYTENENVHLGYSRNMFDTLESPQINSLSVKVLYYLDYLTLKNRRSR